MKDDGANRGAIDRGGSVSTSSRLGSKKCALVSRAAGTIRKPQQKHLVRFDGTEAGSTDELIEGTCSKRFTTLSEVVANERSGHVLRIECRA